MQVYNILGFKKNNANTTNFKGNVSKPEAIRLLKPAIGHNAFSEGVAKVLTDKKPSHEKIYQVYLNGVKGLKHVQESITGAMAQLSFVIPSDKKTTPMLTEGAEQLKRLSTAQTAGNGVIKLREDVKTKDAALNLLMPVLHLNDPKTQSGIADFCSQPYGSPRSSIVTLALQGLKDAQTEGKPKHASAWMETLTKAAYHSDYPERDITLIEEHFKGDKTKAGKVLLDVVTTHMYGKPYDKIPQNVKARTITSEDASRTAKYITKAIEHLHLKNEEPLVVSLSHGTNMKQNEFDKIAHIAKAAFQQGEKGFHHNSMNGYDANYLAHSILKSLNEHVKPRKPLPGFEQKHRNIDFSQAEKLTPKAYERNNRYNEISAALRADDD